MIIVQPSLLPMLLVLILLSSPLSLPQKYKTVPCREFTDGNCQRGSKCSFRHDGVDDPVAIAAARAASDKARADISRLRNKLDDLTLTSGFVEFE